ncbi:MAG: dUTP diphosphatase [Pseudomonadota bacterium]
MTQVRLAWTDDADRAVALPTYATPGAAGADIRANFGVDLRGGITLDPGQQVAVPTGLRMEIPPGYEVQIRPRSGLAFKHQLTILNAPGTIDADYRGEVKVLLFNAGRVPVDIAHGERIAQIVVAAAPQADFTLTDGLGDTARGAGGFGSTGRG